MSRRVISIVAFLMFIGGVVWYATAYVNVPKVTFKEARAMSDNTSSDSQQKKVMVIGKVSFDENANSKDEMKFIVTDGAGEAFPVEYTGGDDVSMDELREAAKSGQTISIAGHAHSDHFHATTLFFN